MRTASIGFNGVGQLSSKVSTSINMSGVVIAGYAGQSALAAGRAGPTRSSPVEITDQAGNRYYSVADFPIGFRVPIPPVAAYTLKRLEYDGNGLVRSSAGVSLQLAPGAVVDVGLVAVPKPQGSQGAGVAPEISDAKLSFATGRPSIEINGKGFLPLPSLPPGVTPWIADQLEVVFQLGDRDEFDENGDVIPIGGTDFVLDDSSLSVTSTQITFDVPQKALVGLSTLRVRFSTEVLNETRVFESNDVRVAGAEETGVLAGRYAFVGLPQVGEVSVIDTTTTQRIVAGPPTNPQNPPPKLPDPKEVARFDVVDDTSPLRPSAIVLGPELTRGYAIDESAGKIAVFDAVALQQYDTDPTTPEIDAIELPAGARPYRGEIDPAGQYLFLTDRHRGSIYVVDVNEDSNTFHSVIRIMNVPRIDAPIGLRDLAVSIDGQRLYAAAPAKDLFIASTAQFGNVLVFDLTPDQSFPLIERIPVGPSPFAITTASDDPTLAFVTDRIARSEGVSILRRIPPPTSSQGSGSPGIESHDVQPIDVRTLGNSPRSSPLIPTFGLNDISGVTYVPTNQFAYTDPNNPAAGLQGRHSSYLVVSAYNRFEQNNPLRDPNLPVLPLLSHPEATLSTGGPISTRAVIPSTAGGNIGLIRLGPDINDQFADAKVVAGTRPTPLSFPTELAYTPAGGGQVLVPYPALGGVWVFSLSQMIFVAENGYNGPISVNGAIGDLFQESALNPNFGTSALVSLPIDDLFSSVDVKADYRFYSALGQPIRGTTAKRELNFGVPPVDRFGIPRATNSHPFAPIDLGSLPMGIATQVARDVIAPEDNPFNQRVNLCETGSVDCSYEVALSTTATVELHSGAVHDAHLIAGYRTGNQTRELVLHYDSLRADPQPIIHFKFEDVPSDPRKRVAIARLKVTGIDEFGDNVEFFSEGIPLTLESSKRGLKGNDHLFAVPSGGGDLGGAVQIDLSEAPSGVYRYELEAGIFHVTGDGRFVGDFGTFAGDLPLINFSPMAPGQRPNTSGNHYGAGWGIAGVYRIYDRGNGILLLANGDGNESIRRYTDDANADLQPEVGDISRLRKDQGGGFTMADGAGTLWKFNPDGLMTEVIDLFGNKTTYEYQGDQLSKITDPFGGFFQLSYGGGQLSGIVDHTGRKTMIETSAGRIDSITDADMAKRVFGYGVTDREGLISTIKQKRGTPPANAVPEVVPYDFTDKLEYNEAGRAKSGRRVDDVTFRVTAAQMTGWYEPKFTTDIDDVSKSLVELQNPVAKHTDELGVEFKSKIDVFGLYASVEGSNGGGPELSRNSNNRVVEELFNTPSGQQKESEYEYDNHGNVKSIKDPNGDVTRFTYEQKTHPQDSRFQYSARKSHTDPFGRVTTYDQSSDGRTLKTMRQTSLYGVVTTEQRFDAKGLIIAEIDELGRTTTYVPDGSTGNTKEIKYPSGPNASQAVEKYDHDQYGNVKMVTDPMGFEYKSEFDAFNRLKKSTGPTGQTETFKYDAAGNVREVIDHLGNKRRAEYDAIGGVIKTFDEEGVVTATPRDGYGRVDRVIDGRGVMVQKITFGSEPASGLVKRIDFADKTSTSFEYDDNNEIKLEIDARGHSTQKKYNDRGQLESAEDEEGRKATYTYDAFGRQKTAKELSGPLITYVYDDLDRQVRSTTGTGQDALTTRLVRDAAGQVLQVFEPGSQGDVEVKQDFDARGRIIRRTIAAGTPLEAVFEYEYDLNGRKTIERDPTGAETKWEYFDDGKIKQVIYRNDLSANEQTTETYEYDEVGRPKKITDAIGRVQMYEYNRAGHITLFEYLDSDGTQLRRVEFKNFNGAGDPTLRVENGVQIVLRYDAMRRIDRETSSSDGDSVTVSRTLNGNGNPERETDSTALVTTTKYDKADRISEMTIGVGTSAPLRSTYTYHANGNVDQIRYLGGTDVRTMDYDFDLLGRPKSVTLSGTKSAQSRTTRYEYGTGGRLSAETDAEGRRLEMERDVLGRVTKVTYAKGTPKEYTTTYEYDKLGRVTAIEVNNQVDGSTVVERTEIEFDSRGYPKKRTEGAGSNTPRVTKFTYDKAGRLTRQVDEIRFGSELTEKISEFDYDGLNRITESRVAVGTSEPLVETRTYDGLYLKQVEIKGPGGNITEYEHDGFGRLKSRTDNATTAKAVKTVYEYDGFGKLKKETATAADAPNRVISYTYEGRNWLASNTSAGRTSTVDYDEYGNPTRMVDSTGRVITAKHDSFDQMIEYTIGEHASDSVTYHQKFDRVGNVVELESPLRTTTYDYNALNQKTKESVTGGSLTMTREFTFDSLGRPITVKDAENNTSRNTYDVLGNLTQTTDALNRNIILENDTEGRTRSITGADGYKSSFKYDLFDRQIEFQDTAGGSTRTIVQDYNATGQLQTLTDPLNRTLTYGYDASGIASNVSGNVSGSALFDSFGVLKESTENNVPGAAAVTYQTAADGLIEQINSATGASKTISYFPSGFAKEVIDVRGTTAYTYTDHGQVDTVSLPAGGTVDFDYNIEGQMEKLIDAAGNTTLFEHDALGRPESITNQSGGVRNFGYDLEGNLETTSYDGGTSIERSYNPVYQIDNEIWKSSNGSVENTVNYTYTDADLPDTVTDNFSSIDFDYDNARRLDKIELQSPGLPDVSIDTDYNLANQLVSQTVMLGQQTLAVLTYGYDSEGRQDSITQVIGGNTINVDLDFDPSSGFLKKIDRGIGNTVAVSSLFDYNSTTKLLESLTHNDGNNNTQLSFEYDRDSDGRVRVETADNRTRTVSYDAAGQVIGVAYQNPFITNEQYDYDFAGNRESSHLPGSYTTGTDNRIESNGRYLYTYDAAGNLSTRTDTALNVIRTFTWDARNRLVGVTDTANATLSPKSTTYRYDSENRRIAVGHDPDTSDAIPAQWRYYIYGNGSDVLAELVDPDGPSGPAVATVDRFMINGPLRDQTLGSIASDGTVTWLLTDQLQSIRGKTDASGMVTGRADFDAFGNLIAAGSDQSVSSLVDERYGFTGREHDAETGLIYYRNRYYDPVIGRFISEDPTGYAGLDENLYRYVANDPINTVDPSGLVGRDGPLRGRLRDLSADVRSER